MTPSIFISLTHRDTSIAEALDRALKALLGEDAAVYFSTSKELRGGIGHGENWFQWIVDKVKECDFSLVLITPASVQKPWIPWEAGAVYGAAVASGQEGLRKVRPLLYRVRTDDLPSPIRDSQIQLRRGDDPGDVMTFFKGILAQYKDSLGADKFITASMRLEQTVAKHIQEVETSLKLAPMLADTNVVEEWRHRLDDLLQQNRASEVEHLHQWLDIAFGRDQADRPQPLDLRLHSKLASLYLKAKKYPEAVQQLELARRLAPRDIYVLRTLGKAYLENKQRDEARAVLEAIAELDPKAFVHNVECAALQGRWYREGKNPQKAVEIFAAALDENPDSHYLANLLGEARLEARDQPGAKAAFERVVQIIEELGEENVWTHASLANAAFVCGDDAAAVAHLRAICDGKPHADTLSTITEGLTRLAANVEGGRERLPALLQTFRR